MKIIQEQIEVRINNFNMLHFIELGYNVKNGDYITIHPNQLPIGSGLKIDVRCDYCGKVFKKAYRRYLETIDDVCCKECAKFKFSKTNIDKYGTNCTLNVKEFKDRKNLTFLNKYGTIYPTKNPEVLEKIKNTNLKKYGVEWFVLSDKMNDILRIRHENNLNYVEGVRVSKSQVHICKLLNGILNFKIDKYYVDIFLEEENIVVEYDGGGHYLSVIHGRISKEDFLRKEKERDELIANMGYNVIRIVDKFGAITDEDITHIKSRADLCFKQNKGNIFIYNIRRRNEVSFKV